MATVEKALWEPGHESGLSRKANQGCWYEAYVPDPLVGRRLQFSNETVADVSRAERALLELDSSATALQDSEAIARLLLRAESVASSKIEGLEIGGRRLLKAQLLAELGQAPTDLTAQEVLGNIEAMRWAVDQVAATDVLAVDHLLAIHRRLLEGTRLAALGGLVRETQNWIGGSSYNPCTAAFVPPPPGRVDESLADLCAFCNSDDISPVVQAAVAHAQFETIHPFADGNGRSGRALIHVILRRRGLSRRVLAPISLVLATWSDEYVAGLVGTRYLGSPDGEAAAAGLDEWVSLFARAVVRAVGDAHDYSSRTTEIQEGWLARLGSVRSDAAVLRLIDALPGSPVITVQTASTLIGRSDRATNQAVAHLVSIGVLRQTTVGRRNRAFEARELIDAFTSLERTLASPVGDTREAGPIRHVPRRP